MGIEYDAIIPSLLPERKIIFKTKIGFTCSIGGSECTHSINFSKIRCSDALKLFDDNRSSTESKELTKIRDTVRGKMDIFILI